MMDAKTATVNGCESIITEPNPAEVRCKPSDKHPWNAVPSMSAKSEIANHAFFPFGHGRFCDAAHAINTNPAGTSLTEATNSGDVAGSTSFIATMLVPHRKNGDTSAMPPNKPSSAEASSSTEFSSSIFDLQTPSTSSSSSLNTHVASMPTTTHSSDSSRAELEASGTSSTSTPVPDSLSEDRRVTKVEGFLDRSDSVCDATRGRARRTSRVTAHREEGNAAVRTAETSDILAVAYHAMGRGVF
jgi:hypothetical protein